MNNVCIRHVNGFKLNTIYILELQVLCEADIFNVNRFHIMKTAIRNKVIQSILEEYEFKRENSNTNKSN